MTLVFSMNYWLILLPSLAVNDAAANYWSNVLAMPKKAVLAQILHAGVHQLHRA